MERTFDLQEYINREAPGFSRASRGEDVFGAVLETVARAMDAEWEEADDREKTVRLEREKRAIIGCAREVRYYKEKIRGILGEKKLTDAWHPPWFPDLTEAVFAELYGLSGLAPWAYDMTEEYRNSSSAKLIGERLYCLIDGRARLQPQRIPEKRRAKLRRTLLLATPKERVEYGFHEVYLQNGIRITIYAGSRTKKGQDVIVLRKYVLRKRTFEELVRLGTIPAGAVPLLKCMVRLGFNVIFSGQVRSGKTTFLQTWQSYEDPELEGLAVATDPETPWHEIMPDAPLMQLIADGPELEQLTKSLLRGDNDYVLLEEMRDAAAFKLALDITSTGTRRSKATIHDNDAVGVPYRMASAIASQYGGRMDDIVARIFQNFDFVFEFTQDPQNKARKIMKGIAAYTRDAGKDRVCVTRICAWDPDGRIWRWYDGVDDSLAAGIDRDREVFGEFRRILHGLAAASPYLDEAVLYPAYYHGKGQG